MSTFERLQLKMGMIYELSTEIQQSTDDDSQWFIEIPSQILIRSFFLRMFFGFRIFGGIFLTIYYCVQPDVKRSYNMEKLQ